MRVSSLYYGDLMNYAWIKNGKVSDICRKKPDTIFTPEVAANYSVRCPTWVKPGYRYEGGEFIKPTQGMTVTGFDAELG